MGMFDYVKDKLHCPYCGEKNRGFQTKSFDCVMETLTIDQIEKRLLGRAEADKCYQQAEIHNLCSECDKRISLVIGSSYIQPTKEVDESARKVSRRN